MVIFHSFPRKHCLLIAFLAPATVYGGLWTATPAQAQFVCTTTPADVTCTNSGTDTSLTNAATGANQNATAINSGTVSQFANAYTTAGGDTALTNSGAIGQYAYAHTQNGGNATLINSGSINQFAKAYTFGGGNAALTNSGTIGQLADAEAMLGGNASLRNSGSVGGGAGAGSFGGAASLVNSGSIGQSVEVFAVNGGDASLTNSGSIGQLADVFTFYGGNASVTNSGSIAQSVTISAVGSGNASLANSGSIGQGVVLQGLSGSRSSVVNSGRIFGGPNPAILFSGGQDTLTVLPGSFIVGAVHLVGTQDTVNIDAGNQHLTFNSLAGATVTGNVPFAVSGNQIASVDPTPFGIADKNLMAFTGAVWGLLGSRGNAADSGSESGALGFAGTADTSSVEDAFAQVMGYARAPGDAVFFKNPAITNSDGTTVWAKGFYGQRTQQADGPNLRNVTQFYGGAIGLDRMVSPDLRLGGFAGGGSTATAIDLNSGTAHSDIGFGGVYGRKDIGTVFVDFALLGGATSNRTTRSINNNLLANGLENATASFAGWFISPELAVGNRYAIGTAWSLTPAARIRYLAAGFDGYTETGSTANLTVGSRTLQNVEERGDLTLTHTQAFANADRLSVSVYSGVLGQQRVGNTAINTILLGQALAFATPGKSSTGGAYSGVGMEWHTGQHVSMFASAEYAAMTDASNTVTGRAGLRYGF